SMQALEFPPFTF
nr:immunoglobulin light chain junction region [Macaca mulatta]MOY04687.1 immunoglobulin light chain junction region [Macaca mulatta]